MKKILIAVLAVLAMAVSPLIVSAQVGPDLNQCPSGAYTCNASNAFYHAGYSLLFEGTTADAFEVTIAPGDPTADRTLTLPNLTGTVATTSGSTFTSTTLTSPTINTPDINYTNQADGYILIYNNSGPDWYPAAVSGDIGLTNAGAVTVNQVDGQPVDFTDVTDAHIQVATDAGGGSWDSVAVSGDIGITNAGVVTVNQVDGQPVDFTDVTDGHIQVATDAGSGSWDSVAMSGDATISNAGVLTIGNNKIGTAELYVNSTTCVMAQDTDVCTVTGTSGATVMGVFVNDISGVTTAANTILNSTGYSGTTFTLTTVAAIDDGAATWTVVFIEP